MLLSNHIGPKFGGVVHLVAIFQLIHPWIHGLAVATSISIPRSAAAAEGRDPRSTAAEGSDRPKAAIRRPKAGVGACRASRARTRAETPIHAGKERPLRPALVCSAACHASTKWRCTKSDDVELATKMTHETLSFP